MKKVFFLVFVLFCVSFSAQEINNYFSEANVLYNKGKYEEAIKLYKKIEDQNMVSTALFFNLGNTYYKLNKVGPSIYYYEKALQLDPNNADVKNNLVFAKRLAIDTIEELPKNVFQKLSENYLQKLTYNQWAIVTVVFAVLGCLFFLLFYFAEISSKKRLNFALSLVFFFFLIVSYAITYNQFNIAKNSKPAIVFAKKATIKNAPTFNAETIFDLHEGTKVIVLDEVKDWKKIKLADGKIGWIPSEEIKEL